MIKLKLYIYLGSKFYADFKFCLKHWVFCDIWAENLVKKYKINFLPEIRQNWKKTLCCTIEQKKINIQSKNRVIWSVGALSLPWVVKMTLFLKFLIVRARRVIGCSKLAKIRNFICGTAWNYQILKNSSFLRFFLISKNC